MTRRTGLRLFYVGPLLLWMALIFFGSTSAGAPVHTHFLLIRLFDLLEPGVSHRMSTETLDSFNLIFRKIGHITEYAVLMLLAVRAFQFGAERLKPRAVAGAYVFSVLYACSDELHQRFIPGRTSSPRDVLIDSLGVTLILLALLLRAALTAAERRLWNDR